MVIFGKTIFDEICHTLSNNYKSEKFIVILSTDLGEYQNIVIQFYKIREENPHMLCGNLDSYQENGMLVAYVNF